MSAARLETCSKKPPKTDPAPWNLARRGQTPTTTIPLDPTDTPKKTGLSGAAQIDSAPPNSGKLWVAYQEGQPITECALRVLRYRGGTKVDIPSGKIVTLRRDEGGSMTILQPVVKVEAAVGGGVFILFADGSRLLYTQEYLNKLQVN